MVAAGSAFSISQFVDQSHLWSVIVILCAFGLYHLACLLIELFFKFVAHVNEEYWCCRARCSENRERFEKITSIS